MESLPELTTGWFREQGVSDPEAVASAWAAWLAMPSKKRTRQTQIRKAMEFASGLSRAAIDHYFHQSTREGKLSASTLHRLNDLCAALGEPLPSASKGPAPSSRSRQPERFAVFLDLHEPPSPRFHVECLESVFAAARSYNFAVTLHQLNTKDPDQRSQVAQVVRSARP